MGISDEIKPFPPGCYYKDGKFHRYSDIAKVDSFCQDDLETICKNIHDKLVRGVEKRLVQMQKLAFCCQAAWIPRWYVQLQPERASSRFAPLLLE